MTEEDVQESSKRLSVEDAQKYDRVCRAYNRRAQAKELPYGHLVEEVVDTVRKEIDKGNKLVRETRRFVDKGTAEDEAANEFFKLTKLKAFYVIGGWVSSLEEYERNLRHIDDLGEKLLQDELFYGVAEAAVAHGDLYVSGGFIARSMRGQTEEKFDYISDVDVLTECPIENFDEMAEDLLDKFTDNTDVKVVYQNEAIPKVSFYSREDDKELIHIVPAEVFAMKAKRVASLLGEELGTTSDIETTLVKWTPDPASQVAIHFDKDLNRKIVNGGAPLLPQNLYRENSESYTNWQTIRKLEEVGAEKDAKLLMRRAIYGIARFPRSIEKGIPLPFDDKNARKGEVKTYQVALAEFIRSSDEESKVKVRARAAENLGRVIVKGERRLWELTRVGFDGLFSPTLLEARGIEVVENGSKVGDTYVDMSDRTKASKNVSAVLGTLPLDTLKDPAIYEGEDRCGSATEYFSVIAGLVRPNDETISQIAEEIAASWPSGETAQESFDKERFLRWSRSIRDAVNESGVEYSQLNDYLVEDTYFSEESHVLGAEYLDQRKLAADAIHASDFWKERNHL